VTPLPLQTGIMNASTALVEMITSQFQPLRLKIAKAAAIFPQDQLQYFY